MQTEEDSVQVTLKKKNDKGQHANDNITVSLDKTDIKKCEKSDSEDPKPRIVLTFRSEKSGAKSSNMKIVPNDEKHDDNSPRRSSRTRGKWEWSDDAEASGSPKKEKDSSQSVSENDEASDSSPAVSKRSTRRGAQTAQLDSVATGVAETRGATQRLSRRIKPTAKILANEELRIGLETQNNARLGIQPEKVEEGVKTRRSARPAQPEAEAATSGVSMKKDTKNISDSKVIDVEILDDDSNVEVKEDPNTVMKLKHLCELGLKAINTDSVDDDAEDEEMEVDEELDDEEEKDDDSEDDEEVDDDSEVISKLLEADEDSSEEFLCTTAQNKRPRRSTRLCSSYGQDPDSSPLSEDEDQKEPQRKSSRRSTRYSTYESDWGYCPPTKRNRSRRRAELAELDPEDEGSRSRRTKSRTSKVDDVHSDAETEDNSRESPKRNRSRRRAELAELDPEDKKSRWRRAQVKFNDGLYEGEQEDNNSEAAGGEEGAEAACPEDESAIVATCYCDAPSNVHAAPDDLPDPVFCQAVECVEGARVGCSHAAMREDGALCPLVRAGPRSPYILVCRLHAAQLRKHMACPACGLFCTQGTFYQCSEGHLFHLECGLPYNEAKGTAGCPHCGVRSYRWQPVNTSCSRVLLRMRCSNKRVYLPDQREQCTQAYLSFSKSDPKPAELTSLIPEDLLPATPIDLKELCLKTKEEDETSVVEAAQELCDAILAMEPVELIIPKITSLSVANESLTSLSGGSAVHAASRRGHLPALHALRSIGADIDAQDNGLKTPLMVAIQALLDKSESGTNSKNKKIDKEVKDEPVDIKEEVDIQEEVIVKTEGEEDKDSVIEKKESEIEKGSDEDLMKVIRYLVAAGCDVNIQGPEGMTALHMGAQHGSADVCSVLLHTGAAEVEPRDHGGWSPLVWAAEHGHTDAVQLLLSHGADAGSCDSEGNGAVHWCALAGEPRALALLLHAAPHAAHQRNAHHDTPLHVAARQGHYACVIILLARGAKTDVENSAGELPADVCSGAVHAAIALNMHMARLGGGVARTKLLLSDISNGLERWPVPVVNEVDDEGPPMDFTYVTSHVLPEPLVIDNTLATMKGCTCEGACGANCACVVLSVRRWWARGRLLPTFPHHDPPMLFQCNQTCACDKRKCENMVVSRMLAHGSLGVRACVFRTPTRGWGLRASQAVPRGAPVAAYCGELLAMPAADTRVDDRYMFALDLKPDLLEECVDKTLLCVDARSYGGAARFMNHSCRASVAPVRVFPDHRDLRLPTVALFATRDLRPGDELTFDYGDKFWSVKSKFMKCECGTPECRYPEKSTESD